MDKLLGFGCMRLPMKGSEVDHDEFNKMIDYYLENGFNYFDTAHGYINGKSELAIRECLVKRYDRSSYILTNKLTDVYFKKEEDIIPLFNKQLEACGVEYFDYYLMHAQNRENYKHFMNCNAYEVAKKLKEEGKIKHLGISFHDTSDILEMILKEHEEIEVVQIQFNYIDYQDPSVQSKECYEICRKYQKQILIMEPVRGGGLIKLPEEAKKEFDQLNSKLSYASYAIRFAASFDGVYKVLSGMSNFEQMVDNVSYMKNFQKINDKEAKAIEKVTAILRNIEGIPCTACRYCVEGCPQNIKIPDLFACYNAKKQFHDWNSSMYYEVSTRENGKASDCIKCGLCEKICPQHINIRERLEEIAKIFE